MIKCAKQTFSCVYKFINKEIFGPVIEALSPHISNDTTPGTITVMPELHNLPLWSPHTPGNPNITVSDSECKDAAD